MSRRAAYLGIDIGTTSVKAAVWTEGSYRVAFRRARLRVTPDGAAEQDPEELWALIAEAVRQVIRQDPVGAVRSVGLTGHSPSLVAVSADGKPVSPVITWMDRRAQEGGGCGPTFEALARWLVSGGAWRSGRRAVLLLQPKDFIAFRLTGRACTDSSSASCWGCHDDASGWRLEGPEEILAGALPPITHPWDVCGHVTTEAAEEVGLPPGTAVVPGSIDAFMEALGAGVVLPGIVCDATGTSTCLSFVERPGPSEDSNQDMAQGAVRHVVPGRALRVSPIPYTGGSLAMAVSMFMSDEVRPDGDWTDLVSRLVSQSPPGASGLVFIPHLAGERSPRREPSSRGAFVGLRPWHARADMVRAVLEGCSFAVRETLDALGPGAFPQEIRAVGSGARHAAWLEIKADVLGVPYASMASCEGALVGAIILGGHGCGDFPSIEEAISEVVRRERVFPPDEGKHRLYDMLYEAYREASSGLERANRVLDAVSRHPSSGPEVCEGAGSGPERNHGGR